MRYTQPQSGPLTLDLGNPLTRGLSIVQTGDANGPFTNINGVTGVTTKLGRAKKFISASSQYLSTQNGVISPTSLTFLVIGSVNSATVNSALISIGAASNDRVLLYVSSTGGLAIFSGQGATTGQATLAGNVTAGQTYVFGGRVNGASFRDNWINGVQQSSDATAVTPAACSTLAVGAYYTTGAPTAAFYLDGSVTLALAWNRPLSDAEMRSVAANPWQIFRSPQRVMLAAAGPDVTVALTGQSATASRGTIAPALSVGMTGQSAQALRGSVSVSGTADVTVALAGQAMTASRGALAPSAAKALIGQAQSAQQGLLTPARAIAISGQSSTVQRGSVSPSNNVTVALVGQAITAAQGSIAAFAASAAKFNQFTIMRANPLNATATMSDAAINRTANLL